MYNGGRALYAAAAATFALAAAGSSDRAIPRAADRTYRRIDDVVTVRLQAQGGGLESSVIVQSGVGGVVTGTDGLVGLAVLQSQLSPKDVEARAGAFSAAAAYIQSASAGGGLTGGTTRSKSFPVPGAKKGERVDVEVIRGHALTPGPKSDAIIVANP